mgnify:CR=1 FL=1
MKPLLSLVIAATFTASTALAQEASDTVELTPWEAISTLESDNLKDFLWLFRPIVVFADSAADPRFEQQVALLKEGAEALQERDVVVLFDTDPSARSDLRKTLRPRGFMVTLIGKEGGVSFGFVFARDPAKLKAELKVQREAGVAVVRDISV